MVYYEALVISLPVVLWAAGLGLISMGFAYFGIEHAVWRHVIARGWGLAYA
ncbi:MAG: hypothetical protein ABR578_07940 [Chromatocurvus sp.]